MSMKIAFLCVVVCNLVCLAEEEATADMPTVMEAIVHLMIDFRREILDNLQFSLEYHTEQLEEIKVHMEYKLIELRDEINRKLEQQQNSSSHQTRELLAYHKEEIKVHVDNKMEEQEKRIKEVGNIVNVKTDVIEHKMEEQQKRVKVSGSKLKELLKEINSTLNQQQKSLFFQMQDLKNQSIANFKILQEHTNRLSNETSLQITNFKKALGEMSSELVPSSCDRMKSKSSGTFYVGPYGNIAQKFLVFCNFDNNFNLGGNFTVFQRRINGSIDFHRNWTMYKYGFGDIKGEHWLGLEKLHAMTSSGRHELLVLLEDFEGNSTYALYDEFKIASEEEKYKLTVGKYSGTAGDSLESHNGLKFCTFDQDNDKSDYNLAKYWKGAWWFGSAWKSHLNGPYFLNGDHEKWGVGWDTFRYKYSMQSATMMLRSRAAN